jgi:hypothetical protein
LLNELIQINFPVMASSQITDFWEGKGGGEKVSYGQRISFTLDLNRMNPLRKIRNISF